MSFPKFSLSLILWLVASAAVAHRLGLCEPDITVHMPGGRLELKFSNGFFATMTGPVARVYSGVMDDELFEGLPTPKS